MVEVDPDKYNISKNNLVINADDQPVYAAAVVNTAIEYTNVPRPINKIALDAQETYSVLIKWTLPSDVSGNDIDTAGCHTIITWGNLTNPPPKANCFLPFEPTKLTGRTYLLPQIFINKSNDTQDLLRITFCSSYDNSRVNISITERQPIFRNNANIIKSPHKIAVPKDKKYKLLIDTSHITPSSEEDYGEPVKIELQQANEKDELIIIISSVGGGMLVLLLFVLILAIVAFICFFTLRRNNLFSLGIAYRNNNNNN